MHISLQPNPSHLEAVDPVVVGKVRARQDMAGDTRARSVMGILMHGDAAFAGQGLVYETLAMSQLIGYRTGGTIHLIVNNQIGFTTVPAHAYSGLYCTDVAKSIQCPILHVNGDEPEAVMFCARLAAEFRMEFGTDFVLDIVCYRRHGHNETDEPAFTQPIMYRAIKDLPTTRTLYAERLAAEGSVPADEAQGHVGRVPAKLEDAYKAAQAYKPNKADWLEGHWAGLKQPDNDERRRTRRRCRRDSCSDRPGALHAAGGLRAEPEDRPAARGQARDVRERRGHRLGDRRGAGVRRPAAGRAAGCGCPARTCSAARSASATPC